MNLFLLLLQKYVALSGVLLQLQNQAFARDEQLLLVGQKDT